MQMYNFYTELTPQCIKNIRFPARPRNANPTKQDNYMILKIKFSLARALLYSKQTLQEQRAHIHEF
jgi:hypothetical protein